MEELDDTIWDQNNKDTTGPNGNVFAHDDDFITVNNSKTHDENSRGQNIQADTPPNSLIFSSRQPVAVDDENREKNNFAFSFTGLHDLNNVNAVVNRVYFLLRLRFIHL
jgi:hypothetical protein